MFISPMMADCSKKYVDQGLAAIEQGVAELQQRHGMLTGAIEIGAIRYRKIALFTRCDESL